MAAPTTLTPPPGFAPIVRNFLAWGDFVAAQPCGTGHIHDTYRVTCDLAGRPVSYLLQRINHRVFVRPLEVMSNLIRVTDHIRGGLEARGCRDVSRRVMTFIPTRSGAPAWQDDQGNWWRMALFIEDAATSDRAQTPAQAMHVAAAFGQFALQLIDLPGARLHESIVNFHNAPVRLESFARALARDPHNRAAEVREEIEFINRRSEMCGRLLSRQRRGEIPERITHNDCKINNVLLDPPTGEGLCVIDLDTVMPGLSLFDFGDMVRTATASADEDEPNVGKVHCRLDMFEGLVRGYCRGATFLSPAEKSELVFGGRLITYLQAMRFLTDYLLGDVYYKIHRPRHNLDRCRTQIRMVQSMEAQEDRMQKIVEEHA